MEIIEVPELGAGKAIGFQDFILVGTGESEKEQPKSEQDTRKVVDLGHLMSVLLKMKEEQEGEK
jgi:hypothetical protein